MINWFKKSEEKKIREDWENLIFIEQLEKITQNSNQKPQIIFKHSTRCYISSKALEELQKNLPNSFDLFDFHFLDLLKHRDISNEIANRFGIEHQSPQVLLLKNQRVIFSETHSSIKADDLVRIVLTSLDS